MAVNDLTSPSLSVVISTLGSYPILRRVLDGYAAQDAPSDSFEVVVVVDAAEEHPELVREAVGERDFEVRCVTGPAPGLSANRNLGWREARNPLVLFTDNDTIPCPVMISEHAAWHRTHPREETGVLGLVRWSPEIEVTTFMRWLDTGIQFDYANIDSVDVGWGRFAGANVSLKRSFIERVGDFDQEHFPYGYEDTDWAYRASKLGFQLLFNERAVVDHLRPMTLEFWKKRARRVAAAEYQFSKLHPELPPWFHRLFTEAVAKRPARGRSIKLARYVPRSLPFLGPRVWRTADIAFKQALAPDFLEAWDEAVAAGGGDRGPNLAEWEGVEEASPSS
jgi:GT2 family glycosyltransferase